MRRLELLTLANEGYSDGFLETYFNDETGEYREDGTGDTVAECIVIELIDTFDPDKEDRGQLEDALRVLGTMARDIEDVRKVFCRRLDQIRSRQPQTTADG